MQVVFIISISIKICNRSGTVIFNLSYFCHHLLEDNMIATMKIKANNSHEASKQILRIVFTSDYHHAGYRYSSHWHVFIYFDASHCKFYFEQTQRASSAGLIKRYKIINMEDAIHITATKYTFSQISVGAIIGRKLMSSKEFFDVAKEHFEWI